MRHYSEAKAGGLVIISSLFGLHQAISHSCGDISVLLDLLGTSGGLSLVPSRKPRILTFLIGDKALLCTQCRGIGPHLSAMDKFHNFSQVAAGTWGTFSSYGSGSH